MAEKPYDIRGWNRPSGAGSARGGASGSAPFGAPAGPSVERGRTVLTRVATLPPYWLQKPPVGTDVYFNETAALAAGAGSAVIFGAGPPAQIALPQGAVGVVAYVTIFVDAPLATLDVIWTLLVNGAPVPGWDRLRSFPRAANNLSIVYPGTVHLPLGARVTVRATNQSAAGPWTVGAEVGGWYWPQIDEQQAFGYGVG
jgi:hypothetical protein